MFPTDQIEFQRTVVLLDLECRALRLFPQEQEAVPDGKAVDLYAHETAERSEGMNTMGVSRTLKRCLQSLGTLS